MSIHEIRDALSEVYDILDRASRGGPADLRAANDEARGRLAAALKAA